MPEWLRRQIIVIGGLVGLVAWFAMLYYMFRDVL
jgi:hypothetical protein